MRFIARYQICMTHGHNLNARSRIWYVTCDMWLDIFGASCGSWDQYRSFSWLVESKAWIACNTWCVHWTYLVPDIQNEKQFEVCSNFWFNLRWRTARTNHGPGYWHLSGPKAYGRRIVRLCLSRSMRYRNSQHVRGDPWRWYWLEKCTLHEWEGTMVNSMIAKSSAKNQNVEHT